MINRDFTCSGKEYIKRNKIVLIVLAVILAVGTIMMCVFGFKGGDEVKDYNTFSVTMGQNYEQSDLSHYTDTIKTNLSEHKASLYSVQLTGEGANSVLVVKYSGKVKDVAKLNAGIAEDLEIYVEQITEHTKVKSTLASKDYIFALACGLIILAIAVVYIAIRYNLACAMTAMGGSLLSVALLMAITSIFRLTINSSFLAINIITMLLVLGESFMLFDGIEKERNKMNDKKDRSTQLSNTLKANAFRQKIMYGAIFAMALVFIILMPNTIKQASLIVLFATIVAMFITVYALPFLWCLTITQVSDKIRVKKDKKVKEVQATEEVEGELDNKYTENQVIEVKEDDGSVNSPSKDDNITIE